MQTTFLLPGRCPGLICLAPSGHRSGQPVTRPTELMTEPLIPTRYGCKRPSEKPLCPDCRRELHLLLWSVLENAGVDPKWKDYYMGKKESDDKRVGKEWSV